jgi:phage-related protein
MGVIHFNGISSAEFGCTIERRPNHTRGSRRGELIEIPGRNGVIVLEDGSYSTYVQQYVVAFEEGDTIPPYKRAEQVAAWLLGSHGFCRLEDDFEPDVYRMARYAGPLNIEQVASEYGRCVIEFECQPQRYLKIGEMQLKYTDTSLSAFTGNSVMAYGVPDNITKIKVVSSVENTRLTLRNPDTSESITVTPVLDDGEWSGHYVSEIEKPDGYRNAVIKSGGIKPPPDGGTLPVGDVLLFFENADESETQILEFNSSNLVLVNPTNNIAKPLLRFYKTSETSMPDVDTSKASATFNGTTVTVDFSDENEIFLDCDLHDAYYLGGANANDKVTFASETDTYPTFPSFGGGRQYIIPADGLYCQCLISPRWWAL